MQVSILNPIFSAPQTPLFEKKMYLLTNERGGSCEIPLLTLVTNRSHIEKLCEALSKPYHK
jgi:hypothetical protein